MKKMEDNDACHDFVIQTHFGKEAAKAFKEEAEITLPSSYLENEFMVTLVPMFLTGTR